jgi:enoyl-CoA hydratase/carnithine racemase
LIPGAGGTQRLPRLIGIAKAANAMLTSQQMRAPEAHELGALDELVESPQDLVARAAAVAREIASGARPRRKTLLLTSRIEPPEQARPIVEKIRAETRKRVRNVEYPYLCLDAILEGAVHGPQAGMRLERELFVRLLQGDVARALIHVFFAERAAAKVPGVTDQGL